MENQKEKKPALAKLSSKKAGLLSVGITILALVILLCICIVSRAHIQSEYADAREEVGQSVYTELYMLCQTFDQVSVPGADVQDGIIPDMREHYLAAQTLNTVLGSAFGSRCAVLTEEELSALDSAFSAYDAAFRTGKSTDDAQAAMQSCVDMVRVILNEKFYDGSLKMN